MGGDNYQTDERINRVRQLLKEGLTKDKIMESVGIGDRALRKYIQEIHEQDKKIWKDQANESLESRAFTIKRKYQELADICDKIKFDEKKSPRDRIEAGKVGIACENNIYNMIKDGPLRLPTVIAKELEDKSKNEV